MKKASPLQSTFIIIKNDLTRCQIVIIQINLDLAVRFEKFLRRFFQKATADPTCEALVAVRRRRNLLIGVFFFAKLFSLRPLIKKSFGNIPEGIFRDGASELQIKTNCMHLSFKEKSG